MKPWSRLPVADAEAHSLCKELHDELKQQTDEFQGFVATVRGTAGPQLLENAEFDSWVQPGPYGLWGLWGFLLGHGLLGLLGFFRVQVHSINGDAPFWQECIIAICLLKWDPPKYLGCELPFIDSPVVESVNSSQGRRAGHWMAQQKQLKASGAGWCCGPFLR